MSPSQSPELIILIYIAVFVGTLLAFEGVRQLLSRAEDAGAARNRRMRMVAKGASRQEVVDLLLASPGRRGPLAKIQAALRNSGLPIGMPGLCIVAAAVGAVAYVFAAQFLAPSLAAPAGLAVAVLLPTLVIGSARKRRLDRLTKQLPEALDLMARGLKVGHPLNVTIGSVASEMSDPIGTEFGLLEDQVSYGDTIVDAFAEMAERLDIEDVRYLAVSIGIQHGSGGNLARILQVLSKVIRDRAFMRKRIQAISAEGRFSAIILSALPFVIFAMISTTSPGFYGDVQDDPLFLPVMSAILGLVVLQAFLLHRMVSFDF